MLTRNPNPNKPTNWDNSRFESDFIPGPWVDLDDEWRFIKRLALMIWFGCMLVVGTVLWIGGFK